MLDQDQTPSQNPFTKIRLKRNRSCSEFAILLDVTPATVRNYEAGLLNAPSRRILDGLKGLGEDPEVITREYLAWRQRRRAELLA